MAGKKILIIDDDQDILRGLHIRLKANGYETGFASDGMSAITAARREKPDLILLDLGLPAGDGFEVLKRLKMNTELSMVPVIVLSARDREANEPRAMKAGARTYLEKPVDDEDLLAEIAGCLGS